MLTLIQEALGNQEATVEGEGLDSSEEAAPSKESYAGEEAELCEEASSSGEADAHEADLGAVWLIPTQAVSGAGSSCSLWSSFDVVTTYMVKIEANS